MSIDNMLYFNGDTTSITLGTLSSLDLTGSFSVEMWLNSAIDTPSTGYILSIESGTSAAPKATRLYIADNALKAVLTGVDSTPTRVTIGPQFPGWNHISLCYVRESDEYRVVYNGLIRKRLYTYSDLATTAKLVLGKGSSGKSWKGAMSDVRVWYGSRSREEIRLDMYRRLSGTEPWLVTYLPLDGDSAALARDANVSLDATTRIPTGESSPAKTITSGQVSRGNVPLQKPAGSATEWFAPPTGAVAAEFDGASSRITVPHSATLAFSSALTIEAWVRPKSVNRPPGSFPVISKRGLGANGSFLGWELRAGGDYASVIMAIGGQQVELSTWVASGHWYHLAAVYDGVNMTLYINGQPQTSVAASGLVVDSGEAMSIGYGTASSNRAYFGDIAEVRVWSVARTMADIQYSRFDQSATNSLTGLAARYTMEPDLVDQSPNGNNATATGVRWILAEVPLSEYKPEALAIARQNTPTALIASKAALQELLDSTDQRLGGAQTQLSNLTTQISRLTSDIATQAAKNDELTAKLAVIPEKDAYITELRGKVKALEGTASVTSLEDFVKNANSEILRARAALASTGSTYALGRVALEVKMMPGSGGAGMRFPNMTELQALGSSQLSTLNVDFEARQGDTGAPSEVVVPTVLGYTEVLARRELTEVGLLVEVGYQVVKDVPGRTIEADRVVNQVPKAGAKVPPGSYVTIFIGRKS